MSIDQKILMVGSCCYFEQTDFQLTLDFLFLIADFDYKSFSPQIVLIALEHELFFDFPLDYSYSYLNRLIFSKCPLLKLESLLFLNHHFDWHASLRQGRNTYLHFLILMLLMLAWKLSSGRFSTLNLLSSCELNYVATCPFGFLVFADAQGPIKVFNVFLFIKKMTQSIYKVSEI